MIGYFIRFSLAYFIIYNTFVLAKVLFNLNSEYGGMYISMLIAIFITILLFVKENQRIPTKREKRIIASFSVMASFILSLPKSLLLGEFKGMLVFLEKQNSQMGTSTLIGSMVGFLLFILLFYFLTSFFYNFFSKVLLKRIYIK